MRTGFVEDSFRLFRQCSRYFSLFRFEAYELILINIILTALSRDDRFESTIIRKIKRFRVTLHHRLSIKIGFVIESYILF